jgi:hypothetical protein
MNQQFRRKKAQRQLEAAEHDFRRALIRYKLEPCEDTQSLLGSAHKRLIELKRNAVLANWGASAPSVLCSRCGSSTRASRWAMPAGNCPGQGPRMIASVPLWAVAYAQRGVREAVRYACTECDFNVVVLSPDTALQERLEAREG